MELSQLLNEIRTHYEEFITSNRIEVNPLSRAQLEEEANRRMSKEEEALKMARAELNEARRQWQSLQVEIESLYALEKGLKNSLQATEDHYKAELQSLAAIIKELEEELHDVRQNIEKQLTEHQTLLNTNVRLEQEITRYRRILEKEESRLGNTLEGTIKQSKLEVEDDLRPIVSMKHVSSGSPSETSLEKSIETVKTEEVVNGYIVKESAEAHGTVRAEKVDAVIRKWEDSFFKDHPRLRKKTVSLRFDLHMAASDENCSQKSQDEPPNIEVRLVMKRSQSIPSINQ
ncbi:keratin-like protein KRT222 [Protopterus annectens]|uniref:keratin-like protein KRT222 n=1 Tax=Protopterus annectens TaxID=7888 RepID=UPI001CFA75CA|nr:keratin-like protein KRT222 [Protopterus annectens]